MFHISSLFFKFKRELIPDCVYDRVATKENYGCFILFNELNISIVWTCINITPSVKL